MDRVLDGEHARTRSSSGDGRTASAPSSQAAASYDGGGDRRLRRLLEQSGWGELVEYQELNGGRGWGWGGRNRAFGAATERPSSSPEMGKEGSPALLLGAGR